MFKSAIVPLAMAGLFALSIQSAPAQNFQAWQMNEAQKINADASMGAINPNQANGLATRDMQIQSEAQRDMMSNGGYLTGYQQNKITYEMKDLDKRINNDIKRNRGNGYNMGYNGIGYNGMGVNPMAYNGMGYNNMAYGGGVCPGGYGYNNGSTGLLGNVMNSGFLSRLAPVTNYVAQPVVNPAQMINPSVLGSGIMPHIFGNNMPAQTNAGYVTPFSGTTGFQHHHSFGI